MSGESENSTVVETVANTVTDAIDTKDGGSLSVDETAASELGRELGSHVGRELGRRIGRELGAVVATDIRDRNSPRTIISNVLSRLGELLKALVRNANLSNVASSLTKLGIGSIADEASEKLEEAVPSGDTTDEGAADEESTGDEDVSDEQSTDEESTDDEDASGDQSTEDESSGESTDGEATESASAESTEDSEQPALSELSQGDLDALKAETYRELLQDMSYDDLQSIAKDSGVKANLAKDEMIDRLVEQFSEDADE